MNSTLVSVITIFLNEESFLQEAIDSVVAQTSPAWELLLIDDGSTDRSPQIARQSVARDPARIHYLTHKGGGNRGKSVSRNLGLQTARGEYVAFLDGDDVFRPEKLERQAAILAESSAAMVYGPTLYWNDWIPGGGKTQGNEMGKLGVMPDRLYEPPRLLTLFLRDGGTVPCICGLTVRRSIALQVGGFDENIQDLYEDQVFLAKLCAQFPVFVESGCWDQYRQHPKSTSQVAIAAGRYHPTQTNPARLTYLRWLEGYLDQKQVRDSALQRALRRALWPYEHPHCHRMTLLGRRVKRRLKLLLHGRLRGDAGPRPLH